ncbi:MAG: phosphohistidine phosphatase SixA [Leptospira sp.]|nr:phosphohistidine phosphatase SixA [Leptospira sp.]
MKLIIARHGEADKDSPTGQDKDRSLTGKGREDIRKMAGFISSTHLQVSHIYHSPYLRTMQTAEIFSQELHTNAESVASEKLAPSMNYSDILPELSRLTNSATVLLIGHNPDVSYFVAKLLKYESNHSCFVFSPGTTVAINIAKENFSNGQIIWIVSPDLF